MSATTVSRPPLLDEVATAEMIGVKPQTLRNWRSTRKVSLPFLRIGGHTIRYELSSVEKFLKKCTVTPVEISAD